MINWEIGKSYKRRDGTIVTLKEIDAGTKYPILVDNGCGDQCHRIDGTSCMDLDWADIVSQCDDQPQTKTGD